MKLSVEEINKAIEGLQEDGQPYTPLDRGIVVLIKKVKAVTDSGLYKGDELVKEETTDTKTLFQVVGVHPQCINIKAGDRIIPKNPGFILEIECPLSDYQYGQMMEYDVYGVFKA